jgi:hypothetical protein
VIAVTAGDGTPGGEIGDTRVGRSGGGASTLAFALLAAASTAGSWCAAVGTAHPGILAMAELGVDLDHLALVPCPGATWPEVTAILLEDMDVVLLCPPGPVRPGVARRLAARARQQRAVLVVVESGPGSWPEGPDVRLTVESGAWDGVEGGHGHLGGRHVEVVSAGRRSAVKAVRTGLWLPAPSGVVAAG